MINYYKYLPVSKEDESWGLTVLNAGCTRIEPACSYPYKNHPAHHNFNWESWRRLEEYQVIYITNGGGIFESEHCPQIPVKAGTIIYLFPGEKHRYKPDFTTGWDEYWVGVKGPVIDNLVGANYILPDSPCQYIGFNEGIVGLFNLIIEKTKLEKTGYQPFVAGVVHHLIGNCHAIVKQNTIGSTEEETIIEKARLLFRANISNPFSAEQAAKELNVGYSWFRKRFKSYTSLSPGQYFLQLKIEKAKEFLSNGSMPIKEISAQLNFDSNFYFSSIFKEKTGYTPSQYRSRARGI
ncbi:AraC family transcriptional regulator [Mucilaginibacter pedocola]|uniref:AraC family transcriptional regulator n=1 Tax=Mucilaginibacter pedocola TaxID=1792845 RepID=A0A1S9P9X0_9SPHI|nr:AraC family transcriptional regulator [Mucilaginibacter pedocola]OOQ57783.1 AraC family transcriptional regulator [Mucilaginibacter pedocola]